MSERKRLKSRWIAGPYFVETAELLASGASLSEALTYVGKDIPRGAVSRAWQGLIQALESGSDLGSSLKANFPPIPKFCVDLLHEAQREGRLAEGLTRVGAYMEDMQATGLDSRALKRTLFYPMAVMVVGFVVVTILMIFVIPQYEELFAGFGAELPQLTRMIISVSGFVANFWWLMLALALLFPYVWRALTRRSRFLARSAGALALRTPWVRGVYQDIAIGEFSRTLALKLGREEDIDAALEAANQAASGGYSRDEIRRIREQVASGKNLADALSGRRLFSAKAVEAAAIGERRKILGKLMLRIADETQQRLGDPTHMTRALEPVVMVILGIIVATVVLGMYLPIFALGQAV